MSAKDLLDVAVNYGLDDYDSEEGEPNAQANKGPRNA